MTRRTLVVVPGTWGRDQTWHRPGSTWFAAMAARGLAPHQFGGRPFEWSTGVDGWEFWRRWFGRRSTVDHNEWKAGGASLFAWCVPPLAPEARIPSDELAVVSHSHGLQVVLYAAAAGLKLARFVSVTGPVRADMLDVAKAARPNIGRWVHVHSDGDRMQWFGEAFDGMLGVVRRHPFADENWFVPGAGHSGLFHDPARFDAAWSALAAYLAE